MKKNKLFYVTVLSTACLLSLASCQGAQGPKGDQGDPGINGTNGKDGENGKDGKSCLNGKGVPASSLGSDGDSYIDTESFDFYVKESGAWTKKGSLKGTSEATKGEDGTSIRTGKGVPSSTLGKDGDSYIDLSTFDFYVKANGTWSKEGNIKGDKGNAGASGADGKQGETAWSNTILSSKNGYVTVDKGSAVAKEGNTFTFTFVPDQNYKISYVELNGTLYSSFKKNTLTVPVVEGGYVVKATFVSESTHTSEKATMIDEETGASYETISDAITENANSVKLTESTSIGIEVDGNDMGELLKVNSSLTIDLNGHDLGKDESGNIYDVKGNLTIENSSSEKGTIYSTILAYDKTKITLKNIKTYNKFMFSPDNDGVIGSPIVFNFEDVDFQGSLCAFETYGYAQYNKENFQTNFGSMNFKGCTFKGIDSDNKGCSVGASINLPVTAIFEDCEFIGSRNSLIVKAGDVTCKNCTFTYDGKYDGEVWVYADEEYEKKETKTDYFLDGTQGDETLYLGDFRVASAMIAVGNANKGAYKYASSLVLENCTAKNTVTDKVNHKELFVVNDGTYNSSVTIDEASLAMFTKSTDDKYTEILYYEDTTASTTSAVSIMGNSTSIKDNCTHITRE